MVRETHAAGGILSDKPVKTPAHLVLVTPVTARVIHDFKKADIPQHLLRQIANTQIALLTE